MYNALLEAQNLFVNPIQQQCNSTLRKVQLPQAEDKVRFQEKELCMLRLHGTSITYRCTTVLLFSFSQLCENMKSNKDPPVITSVLYTESLMVSSVVFRE